MGEDLIGRSVLLPGYFDGHVRIEDIRPLGAGHELRVRLADGHLEGAVLSETEFAEHFLAWLFERYLRGRNPNRLGGDV